MLLALPVAAAEPALKSGVRPAPKSLPPGQHVAENCPGGADEFGRRRRSYRHDIRGKALK
ncbi:MAG TPA: hypothetical protein VFG35_23485 [Actinoplanes sp.]|nr:hypothetical protein [Actinoplanes sp.]